MVIKLLVWLGSFLPPPAQSEFVALGEGDDETTLLVNLREFFYDVARHDVIVFSRSADGKVEEIWGVRSLSGFLNCWNEEKKNGRQVYRVGKIPSREIDRQVPSIG